MDNGPEGALLLANQMSSVVHDLEQKRVGYLKYKERKKDKSSKSSVFKSADQLDKEKSVAKWTTAKVIFSFLMPNLMLFMATDLIFKLRRGASISRFVCRSVGLSVEII